MRSFLVVGQSALPPLRQTARRFQWVVNMCENM